MASAIRLLMVVVLAGTMIVATATAQSGGLRIPPSLSGGSGNRTTSGAGSMAMPEFTGGIGTRSGGPSTEPMATRDNSWLSDSAAARQGRPSTAPYTAGSSNDLRSGSSRSTIATVAATEDPNSPEAQRRTAQMQGQGQMQTQRQAQAQQQAQQQARSQSQSGATSNAGSTGSSSGFGSLPDGISLPPRTPAATSAQLANSGQSGASNSFSRGATYGPKTAEEANFDWSGYNAAARGGEQRSGVGLPSTMAQQNLGTSGSGFGNPFGSAMQPGAASSSSGLGTPGVSSSAATALPSSWTSQQIAALGEYFGVGSNDSRMTDPRFVNRLYSLWREDQTSSQTGLAGSTGDLVGNGSNFNLPGFTNPDTSTRSGSSADSTGAAGRQVDTPAAATTADPAAGQSGRRIDFFDSFGNRIDANGNILDENGRPVDEATRYELTIGRKIREDMQRLAREQSELAQQKRMLSGGAGDRLASRSQAGTRLGQTGEGGATPGSSSDASNEMLSANDALQNAGGAAAGVGQNAGSPSPDRASLGDTAKAIGTSNPYVNVFLLCSLVANVFLFIWLQRLWYHHRDLIASSRMASSGISTND